jgi:hypothetical protein
LNWQSGSTGEHDVPAGVTPGKWTINGVRAHEIETDHTGNFVPVSATIRVSPLTTIGLDSRYNSDGSLDSTFGGAIDP